MIVRDPRILQTIQDELKNSSVSPKTEEFKPFLQQNLNTLSNISKSGETYYSESKSILQSIHQELKKISNLKDSLKEASLPSNNSVGGKEDVKEIRSGIGNISTAITALVDLLNPVKTNISKLVSSSDKHLNINTLLKEQSDKQHKLSIEAAAKQHRESQALLRDLDEDLEYQTEHTRKNELAIKEQEKKDRTAKAGEFAKNLFSLIGLKPVWDFLKIGVDFFKGGLSFLSLGWGALTKTLTTFAGLPWGGIIKAGGLLAITGWTANNIKQLIDLTKDIAGLGKYTEGKEKETDEIAKELKKRQIQLESEKKEKQASGAMD
jgi:hypothetical protein